MNLVALLDEIRLRIQKLDTANVSFTKERILEALDNVDGVIDNRVTFPFTFDIPVKFWFVNKRVDIRGVVWYNIKDGKNGVVVHSYKIL